MRSCVKCGDNYALFKGKPGFVNECANCGRDSEKGMTKLKGVMIYPHKTSAEIQILPEESAMTHIKAASRHSKRTNLGHNSGTETIIRNVSS